MANIQDFIKKTEQRLAEMGLLQTYRKIQAQQAQKRQTTPSVQKPTGDLSSLEQSIAKTAQTVKTLSASMGVPLVPQFVKAFPKISAAEAKKELPLTLTQTPPPTSVVRANQNIFTTSQGITGVLQQMWEQQQKALEEAQKQQAGLVAKFKEWIGKQPSVEEVVERERQRWQVPQTFEKIQALIPEISSLQEQINQLNVREQQALLNAEQRLAPMEFIRGEQALIQRQYAIERSALSAELGAKTALAQMYQGNISLARSLISDTIQAMTYDIQQKRQDFEFFYNANRDYIKTLEAKQQNVFNNILQQLREEEERKREEYQQKLQLILDAAAKGVNLGLSTEQLKEMSLEEVSGIYAREVGERAQETPTYAPPEPYRIWQLSGGKAGTGMDFGEWYKRVYKATTGEKVKVPTIYGLTPTETQDVLFSPTPPQWFKESMETETYSILPEYLQQLWDNFKQQAIERHNEIKRKIGSSSSALEEEFKNLYNLK